MSTAIVKYERKPEPDGFIVAMFLLWASRPGKRDSETDGSYFIGEVGEVPEKNWARPIGPYSIARPRT